MVRRTAFLVAMVKGTPLRETIEQFSADYKVSDKALYYDWAKRSSWIPQIVQLHDPTITDEMFQGVKEVLRRAWFIHEHSQNEAFRFAALKLAMNTYTRMLSFLAEFKGVEPLGVTVDEEFHRFMRDIFAESEHEAREEGR